MNVVTKAVYAGLSDSLSAAIDTGNADEVAAVLANVADALDAGQISIQQHAELNLDAEIAGYDL